jgi:hypothetical protein
VCRALLRGGRNTKHGNILCRKAAAVFEDVPSRTTHRPPLFGAKTRHVCSVGCGWPETSRQFSAQTRAMTWRGLVWPGLEWRALAWLSLAWLVAAWRAVPCRALHCFALEMADPGFQTATAMRCEIIVFSFPRLGLGSCVLCTVSFALCLYYGVGTLIF